ncbi:MAG: hypothetical protein ACI3Z5_07920 [Paludibacteraceae bacterium]
MARITYTDPVDHLEGRLTKDGTIHRQKVYRDKNGKVLSIGKAEVFLMENPRDYTKKPLKGAELENTMLFRQAAQLTILERSNPDRMQYWTRRFQAQLETPEQDAPVDKRTGQRKIYCRLDAFIRACIYRDLRAKK